MSNTAFLCGPSGIYLYKGIHFETQNTGCPIWPMKWPSCSPYARLSKDIAAALDEMLAMTREQREEYAI